MESVWRKFQPYRRVESMLQIREQCLMHMQYMHLSQLTKTEAQGTGRYMEPACHSQQSRRTTAPEGQMHMQSAAGALPCYLCLWPVISHAAFLPWCCQHAYAMLCVKQPRAMSMPTTASSGPPGGDLNAMPADPGLSPSQMPAADKPHKKTTQAQPKPQRGTEHAYHTHALARRCHPTYTVIKNHMH